MSPTDRFGIGEAPRGSVVVVGSLNMDLILQTARYPEAGESVTGWSYRTLPGGKGANQAVAVARQGTAVEMVGCVGQDEFGNTLLKALKGAGVGTEHIHRASSATGVAMVTITSDGESRIIVVPGANRATSAEQVRSLSPLIAAADYVLVQLEIPMESVMTVAEIAARHKVPLVLNPSPVPVGGLPDDLLAQSALIVPNRLEVQRLTGESDPERAAQALRRRGARRVIVTLGAEGAIIVTRRGTLRVAPFPVEAVDSTAAGDAFVGALVAALTRGERLRDAALYGSAAGAVAVTQVGAQSALPTLSTVEAMVSEREGRLPPDYPEALCEIGPDATGMELLIRPILPGDAPRLKAHFESLSQESIYRRFFTHRRYISDNEVRDLATVDYRERMAVVAAAVEQPDTILGVARYAVTPARDNAVEMAVVVLDAYQRHGIGKRLMQVLIRAAQAAGYRWMLAETHYDNRGMISLAERMGLPIEQTSDGDLLQLWLDLKPRA